MSRGATGRPPNDHTRLAALRRNDKWYLSCGDGIVWAPPFPVWLDRPGFWDEALVYQHPFAPLFSVALVTQDGGEAPLTRAESTWQPDRLTIRWDGADALVLVEQRYALPGGRLISAWRRDGGSWAHLQTGAHLVAFTAQPGESTGAAAVAASGRGIAWRRTLVDRHDEPLDVAVLLEASHPSRVAALRVQGTAVQPVWRLTPFWDSWTPEGLRQEVSLDGLDETGLVYVALAVPLSAVGDDVGRFTMTLTPLFHERDGTTTRNPTAVTTAPAPTAVAASPPDPSEAWREWFAQFPVFTCADPYFTRYYDYRLYGLYLNRLAGGAGNVQFPAVAEGIGYFHVPITYSAQCHMWETRWAADPTLAHGSLLNFIATQTPEGAFHGRVYATHLRHTDFYHGNWGDAVLAVDSMHPDGDFLARAYEGLARYTRWLDASRDPEGSGMYDVTNQYETGQEYMSRYQVVADDADRRGWGGGFRLKGIDVTVYAYQLKRALGVMAGRLGRADEAVEWGAAAQRIGDALVARMWDPAINFFTDVDPRSGQATGVKAAVGFYPLLTDLLTEEHVARLLEHLQNPEEFWTPFPVPSSSADDPLFDPDARWKGKRHNCPWNGRVWPMLNSHVLEGLLRQWHAGRREVGPVAAALLERFLRMLFHDRDPARPNCYEHYHPYTGRPSAYRGIDDYQHSWVLDLLIRGVAGLEPTGDGLLVDPLPLATDEVRVEHATIRGHAVSLERVGNRLSVTVDGEAHRTEFGVPLFIPLPPLPPGGRRRGGP